MTALKSTPNSPYRPGTLVCGMRRADARVLAGIIQRYALLAPIACLVDMGLTLARMVSHTDSSCGLFKVHLFSEPMQYIWFVCRLLFNVLLLWTTTSSQTKTKCQLSRQIQPVIWIPTFRKIHGVLVPLSQQPTLIVGGTTGTRTAVAMVTHPGQNPTEYAYSSVNSCISIPIRPAMGQWKWLSIAIY